MTRLSRITTVEQADVEMEQLGPRLYRTGYPFAPVRRVLLIVAFLREEVEHLRAEIARMTGQEQHRPGFVARVESKRK